MSEGAPLQYVLEITEHLEEWELERKQHKDTEGGAVKRQIYLLVILYREKKKREATVTAWLLLAVFLDFFLFCFHFFLFDFFFNLKKKIT